jgi:hypothetical protein
MPSFQILWSWCSHCEIATAICPTCRNNACGAGRGTVNGLPCTDCDRTHAEWIVARRRDLVPYFEQQYEAFFGPQPNAWDQQCERLPNRSQRRRKCSRLHA